MTEKLKFVLGRIENIVGKGENGGYQHFLFFPQCIQKAFYTGLLKVMIVWQRLKDEEKNFEYSFITIVLHHCEQESVTESVLNLYYMKKC